MKKTILSLIGLIAIFGIINAQDPPENPIPRGTNCPTITTTYIYAHDSVFDMENIAVNGNWTGCTLDIYGPYNYSCGYAANFINEYNHPFEDVAHINNTYYINDGYQQALAKYNIVLHKSGCTDKYKTLTVIVNW